MYTIRLGAREGDDRSREGFAVVARFGDRSATLLSRAALLPVSQATASFGLSPCGSLCKPQSEAARRRDRRAKQSARAFVEGSARCELYEKPQESCASMATPHAWEAIFFDMFDSSQVGSDQYARTRRRACGVVEPRAQWVRMDPTLRVSAIGRPRGLDWVMLIVLLSWNQSLSPTMATVGELPFTTEPP